jgi:hypothetical protein
MIWSIEVDSETTLSTAMELRKEGNTSSMEPLAMEKRSRELSSGIPFLTMTPMSTFMMVNSITKESLLEKVLNLSNLGKLKEIKGLYEGDFLNGEKNGKGTYRYNSGIRYVGDYVRGLKEGEGTIYNEDNTVAYSGQWKTGLPNGKGYVMD